MINEELAQLQRLQEQFRRSNHYSQRDKLLAQLLDVRDALNDANEDDIPQLVEQMGNITNLINQTERQDLEGVDPQNPYFARLIAQEGKLKRDFYIGSQVYAKPGIQIVDWRKSPIAALYFRYDVGDEYDEEIGEQEIEGVILEKRVLRVDWGQLISIQTKNLEFHLDEEGHWLKRNLAPELLKGGAGTASRPERIITGKLGLGAEAGLRGHKHLPEITSLIDHDQFDLISAPANRILAIQGRAGSGKTTVALHRVAWLHHQNPQEFAAEKMLVLVFNRALANYISKILPSLGVPGVNIDFFEHWAYEMRKKIYGNLLPKAQAHHTPVSVIRLKKHPRLMQAMDSFLTQLEGQLQTGLEKLFQKQAAPFALRRLSELPWLNRLKALWDWSQAKRELFGHKFSADLETKSRLEALVQEFIDPEENIRRLALNIWDEFFSDFALIRDAVSQDPDFTPGQLQEALTWIKDQYSQRHQGQVREEAEEESGPQTGLDVEDDAILIYLYGKLAGDLPRLAGQPAKYRHLLVDEAQDYAPIELKVMLLLAEQPYSLTFAGDVHQQLVRYNSFTDWPSLFTQLGLEGQTVSRLQVSYRSSFEIMDFACKVLGDLNQEQGFTVTRHGPAVELFAFRNQGEQARFLGQALKELMYGEPHASCAVICADPQAARLSYAALERMDIPRLRLVVEEDFTFTPGVDITEVSQVKGLEFDYVVVLDGDAVNYPAGRYHRFQLHVAATRAAHQLWIANWRLKSPLLPEDLIEIKA